MDRARLTFLSSITSTSKETEVEHKIVIPLLRLLGYTDADWRTQARIKQSTADFLIHPTELLGVTSPYLVIEAKAPNQPIHQNCWQLKKYMRQFKTPLGLLTNGFQFLVLSQYQEQIAVVVDYSARDLANNFPLVYKLLCKQTALNMGHAVLTSQQRVQFKFLTVISDLFSNEDMLNIFRRKANSPKPTQPRSPQPEPAEMIAVQNVVEDIPNDIVEDQQKRMIITVFNNKGGVGKTTLTINLAAMLTQLGKRVLLVDIDAQANLSTGLGIDPLNDVEMMGKKDITHLLIEPRTKLKDVVYHKTWNDIELDIVPSHIRLSNMESELIQTVDSDRILAKKLKNHDYDFVFIDPPPSFGKVNSISLMASSAILIPTQLSPYPIRALEYVIDRVRRVEDYKDDELPILGIAVSMYDQRSSSFNQLMEKSIRETLAKNSGDRKIELFPEETWIPRLNIISRCPDNGYPIQQAEFDDQISSQEKVAAQSAVSRLEALAKHLMQSV